MKMPGKMLGVPIKLCCSLSCTPVNYFAQALRLTEFEGTLSLPSASKAVTK